MQAVFPLFNLVTCNHGNLILQGKHLATCLICESPHLEGLYAAVLPLDVANGESVAILVQVIRHAWVLLVLNHGLLWVESADKINSLERVEEKEEHDGED